MDRETNISCCVFVSCEIPGIYYVHTSLSSTYSLSSDSNLGTPVTQSRSMILWRHCGKRLLDGVDTSQGLALGKQREQKGRLVDMDCNILREMIACKAA